jgi:hypothetical protein
MLNYISTKIILPSIYLLTLSIVLLYISVVTLIYMMYVLLSFYFNPNIISYKLIKVMEFLPTPIPKNKNVKNGI